MAQMLKNLPATQETRVPSLGWEDLEKGMAIHSSIFAWKIPWTVSGKLVHRVTKSQTRLSD